MWVVLLIYSREEKAMVTEDKVSDTLATWSYQQHKNSN